MATPATKFFLTIEYNRVVVKYDGTHGGEVTRTIKDERDYRDFFISKAHEAKVDVEALDISASSSLDFPHEFTDAPKTVALAIALRG